MPILGKKYEIFRLSNMVIIFSNILFFIVVQTLFFKYIASKQFEIVLKDKINIFNTYLKYDSEQKEKIKKYLEKDETKQMLEKGKLQENERNKLNNKLIIKWIGIPFIVTLIIFIASVGRLKLQNKYWTKIHTGLLLLVVTAYLTELFVYFAIVRQYKFYGDHELYATLFNNLYDLNKKSNTMDDNNNNSESDLSTIINIAKNMDLKNMDLKNMDIKNMDLKNIDLKNMDLNKINNLAQDIKNYKLNQF